jgi:hypothetical protein
MMRPAPRMPRFAKRCARNPSEIGEVSCSGRPSPEPASQPVHRSRRRGGHSVGGSVPRWVVSPTVAVSMRATVDRPLLGRRAACRGRAGGHHGRCDVQRTNAGRQLRRRESAKRKSFCRPCREVIACWFQRSVDTRENAACSGDLQTRRSSSNVPVNSSRWSLASATFGIRASCQVWSSSGMR